jgi:methyl-accepting chemotaxis protein
MVPVLLSIRCEMPGAFIYDRASDWGFYRRGGVMRVPVKMKIGVAFAVVIVLSAISAVVSINGISSLNGTVTQFADVSSQRIKLALQMQSTMLEIVRAEKNMILEPTDEGTARFDKELLGKRDDVKALKDKLIAVASDEGKQKLQDIGTALDKFYTVEDKVRDFAKINSVAKATALSQKDARQALNAVMEPLATLAAHADTAVRTEAGGFDQLMTAYLAQKINADLLREQRDEKNIILADTDQAMDTYAKTMADIIDVVRHDRDGLRKIVTNDEDRRLVEAFADRFEAWLKIHDEVVRIARQNSASKALALSTGEGRELVAESFKQIGELVQRAETMMGEDKTAGQQLYNTVRTTLFAMLVLSLVVAIGSAVYIAISISRGLGRAVGLANAVAIGDLDQKVEASSNDEIKDLIDALNRMTANLSGTAGIAGEIAKGNVNVEVRPLSERDALGNAFATMARNLRGTAQVAAEIAKGNLAVEVKPLSDQDVLGTAFAAMVTNLRATAANAEEIAKGNLAVEVKPLSAQDVLGTAFAAMVKNLRATASVAEEIAKGDLAVEVKPLSAQDVLGLAFAAMVKNLRATASVAEEIARGNLAVEVKPLSEHDMLGLAFAAMVKNLRATASVAEEIARGNLTVEAKRLSDLDTLGIALETMLDKLRQVVTEAGAAANNVASGAQQLSSSAETLSQGATEQASAAEEASASMEEMAANIKQTAENSSQTEKIARQSAKDAQASGDAVSKAVEAMQTIAGKITIVQEIARQTDLLALNAAVEAARAGEHGKGFAVVASEVRKLAERSQVAATEIVTLSGDTVKAAGRAGEMLAKLVPDISRTAELVEEISAACREQDIGAQQVNTAIQQLDQVTQQNAAASEETSATSEELASQAEVLQDTIAYFRVDKTETSARAAAPPARSQVVVPHLPVKSKSKAPALRARGKTKGAAIALDPAGGSAHDDDFERY